MGNQSAVCVCPLANIGKQVCTYIGTGTAAERWVCSPSLNYNWCQLGWWPRFRQRIFTCTQVKLGWLRFRPYILKLKASSKSSQKPPIILHVLPKNRLIMRKLSSVLCECSYFCHSPLNYIQHWAQVFPKICFEGSPCAVFPPFFWGWKTESANFLLLKCMILADLRLASRSRWGWGAFPGSLASWHPPLPCGSSSWCRPAMLWVGQVTASQ